MDLSAGYCLCKGDEVMFFRTKPDAYEVKGKRRTLEELREEWEALKDWGCTTENFDKWKSNMMHQGIIKAIF